MWRARGSGIFAICADAALRAVLRDDDVLLALFGSLNQSPPCFVPADSTAAL
jgi:hypothetical protein